MGFGSQEAVVVEEEKPEDTVVSKQDFEAIREQAVESRKKREAQKPSQGLRHPHHGPVRKNSSYRTGYRNKSIPQRSVSAPLIKREKVATTSKNLIKKTQIIIDKNITVKEFSEKM
ncbi:MAG: hypothetical protein GXP45_02955 [bacterium]|nr:hypothetical protein [bacterium]